MKTFKEFLEEGFLKTKKIFPKIYQIVGTNAFIDGQEKGWKLKVMKIMDNIHDAEWVDTFISKGEALKWLEDNPDIAKLNGIKRIK